MKHIFASFIFIIAIMLSSCEDTVIVDSGFESSQLVVDAWVDNRSDTQTIVLSYSQDYFDNTLPQAEDQATVNIINGENTYEFFHTENGRYHFIPEPGTSLGSVGDELQLRITVGDDVYSSTTSINRVPPIDSISIVFEDEVVGRDPGLFGELYARDFEGQGDAYWIRTWKNDTLLNRPLELVIVYDASFDPGTNLDGVYFIRPLRLGINAVDDDGLPIDYVAGDHIYVELHSISVEAFQFLQIVQEQTTNGNNTIFALPIANAKTNILVNGSQGDVLGFFNVAAISSIEKTVEG